MIGRLVLVRLRGLPLRARAALAGLFFASLVLCFPLRLALAAIPGLAARDVQGPALWGEVYDLRFGPVALPYARAGVLPWGGLWLSAPNLHGRVSPGSVTGLTGTLPLPGGVEGVTEAELTDLTVRYADGRCVAASGMVRFSIATPTGPLPLTGKAHCAGPDLAVKLEGPGGLEKVELRVGAGGRVSLGTLPM
ncbi:hypothetical protein [Novosphingobium cyanobacteriorum]|uniref:General secretion pathway protein N n=1 Tax=Novosphingobium cyanobacteriorum TaxID=3024215 RepID=A0ABT6CFL1_9SPHN|nr:hypothetical protein [Novosphingobium cyanobacteriorum]MDF8332714.1 hypothetical protein [Novosphingobium cyanobacteriorum]